MSGIYVPPNGFVGLASQTIAAKWAQTVAGTRRTTGKRRKKRKAKSATKKRAKRSSTRKRLVKGSAAAKAYMAKIRKKRK